MKIKILPRVFSLMIAVMLAVLSAVLTWGTTQAYVFSANWSGNGATWKYGSSLPSSFQDGTSFGAYAWTSIGSSSWTYTYNSGSSNEVRYVNIDGGSGKLAETSYWVDGQGYITQFLIEYDNQENWYTGSSTPGGSQIDLRSIAAHEFGHTLGLWHTDTTCNGTSSDATMCPFYTGGSTWWRTPATDDIAGITDYYP